MAHVPICVSEILNFFPEQENGIYLDVTGGGGGHSEAILKLKKNGKPRFGIRILRLLKD